MRSPMTYTPIVLGLSLGVLATCAFDPDTNSGQRCGTDDSCPAGLTCYRGFCVSSSRCEEEGAVAECYDAALETEGVGICRSGERFCRRGAWTPCLGQVIPTSETCNGLDDDCDRETDEVGGTCETGVPGVCAQGALTCRGTEGICVPASEPTVETCDRRDEDCDGETDEETDEACYPAEAAGCVAADGGYACVGVCSPGVRHCEDGELTSCEGAVTPAASDGCNDPAGPALDDDCDGPIDEDCDCASGERQSCYSGPPDTEGEGPCHAGIQECSGTPPRFGECVDQVVPVAESCLNDGSDDDCDGDDDDVEGRGDPCTDEGSLGECRLGLMDCRDGSLECVTPTPQDETCNGRDDDCDGDVDEDFDTRIDARNCGRCGVACGEGLTCCGGSCVDQSRDEAHCGSCNRRCGEGLLCCSGTCVDPDSDGENCGTCGNECGAGWSCCDGSCADARTDPGNCGDCGTACGGGESCCGGSCAPSGSCDCSEDCALLGRVCCDGSCVDVDTDESNCRSCGTRCSGDQLCCGGACVPSDPSHCGQGCAPCTGRDLCCEGECTVSDARNCNSCGNECDDGEECCPLPVGCTDLDTDSRNCGGCGESCRAGESCARGHCCPSGQDWCGERCVAILSDSANCGSCGNACLPLQRCEAGRCVLL